MTQNDTDPMAPGLPGEDAQAENAVAQRSEGDTRMPSAARLVIDEPPISAACEHGAPTLATLAAEWERLNRSAREAWDRFDAAAKQAEMIMPDYPESSAQLDRKRTATRGNPTPRIRGNSEHGQPPRSALELWEAQVDAIEAAFGVPQLEADAETAQRAANCLADRIADMRPNSVVEAALKFSLLRIRFEDGNGGFDQPAKIHDFQSDLDHLVRLSAAR